MKIAINELGGSQWTGGVTYRRNLIKALRSHPNNTDIFMISKDGDVTKQFAIAENQVIKHTGSAGFITKKIDAISRKFFKYDYLLSKSIKGKDIDVLFPGHFSVGKEISSVYWMPDFQFMHLPHLFGKSAVEGYNKKLPEYFENANLIVLSSKDAQKDFKSFSPQYLDKTRVMNFVAHVPEGLYDEPTDLVRKTYNLPEEFIYLPNQFWAHKNHIVVLKALKILKEQNIKPFLVFTGNPVDVRNPMYLGEILQQINEWGIRDQVAFLGLIPHKFVYSLIRNSKFVLNPSLFEGWSTIVEESKSVGKRLLLSNLGVHIEQDPANSTFFDPHSPEDCAEKMKEMWQTVPGGPDLEMEKIARAALPERMKVFADTFLSICKEATTK
jgi:glycosyltransferase involved in cell wall biosynthesis